jgi:hypothetical protein
MTLVEQLAPDQFQNSTLKVGFGLANSIFLASSGIWGRAEPVGESGQVNADLEVFGLGKRRVVCALTNWLRPNLAQYLRELYDQRRSGTPRLVLLGQALPHRRNNWSAYETRHSLTLVLASDQFLTIPVGKYPIQELIKLLSSRLPKSKTVDLYSEAGPLILELSESLGLTTRKGSPKFLGGGDFGKWADIFDREASERRRFSLLTIDVSRLMGRRWLIPFAALAVVWGLSFGGTLLGQRDVSPRQALMKTAPNPNGAMTQVAQWQPTLFKLVHATFGDSLRELRWQRVGDSKATLTFYFDPPTLKSRNNRTDPKSLLNQIRQIIGLGGTVELKGQNHLVLTLQQDPSAPSKLASGSSVQAFLANQGLVINDRDPPKASHGWQYLPQSSVLIESALGHLVGSPVVDGLRLQRVDRDLVTLSVELSK